MKHDRRGPRLVIPQHVKDQLADSLLQPEPGTLTTDAIKQAIINARNAITLQQLNNQLKLVVGSGDNLSQKTWTQIAQLVLKHQESLKP